DDVQARTSQQRDGQIVELPALIRRTYGEAERTGARRADGQRAADGARRGVEGHSGRQTERRERQRVERLVIREEIARHLVSERLPLADHEVLRVTALRIRV